MCSCHMDYGLTELAAQVCSLILYMLLHITLTGIMLSHLVKIYITQHKKTKPEVHKFSKNLGTTAKFWVPEG